jgi:hypothetical protein
MINYTRWNNSTKSNLFPRTQVLVKLPEPLPPTLFIEAVDDAGSPNGRGDNIKLSWIPSSSPKITHYLIYRSESQTDFDFSSPWRRTDSHSDNGIIPLRTSWNDTDANSIGMANYNKEWYYIVRAVNEGGQVSHTSRTVGKWTRAFDLGVSAFSLPLEPLQPIFADDLTTDMDAAYIKYIDYTTHTWRRHDLGGGGTNNSELNVGEGFEVRFSAADNRYTFCGMPGAMILYDDDSGFSGFDYSTEAKNLNINIEPNGDVTLSWTEPSSMGLGGWYEIYYSNARDGFFGMRGVDYSQACPDVDFGSSLATHSGAAADSPGSRLYYMIVPYNESGIRGAGTYSIGIWTEEYLSQYDTMGLPLKLSTSNTVDWYCDNIPDVVGINYLIFEEQRWGWHSTRMPEGVYDTVIKMAEGYQISTAASTKYSFIGI